ncbi:MAG TPA: SDR family NAD(P)-dependent oxidoreductase [Xanthomonadales bacterium]|nr:SDR family NAD(P)-dependent oxidoreductase [Xanthomonadales bacterium]
MAFTADIRNFDFGDDYRSAFEGKRVLITGSGKDGGIGQAIALAAAANGAKVIGVHFHSSYRDGFDLVAAIRKLDVDAFALQADVNSLSDLWASRSYIVEQMGGVSPDIIVCNSGLTEQGYMFGRALPEVEGERRAERRARVRQSFIDNLTESKMVLDTKIDGFVSLTHLWAGEAAYHKHPLQLIYVSSMQAIEPGVAVPGYAVANWAVLRLPEVLRVNLGRSADMVSASCIMLPFIRTGMTEEYADNTRVFGRWQSRMLETHEAAKSITQLLLRPAGEVNLGHFKLNVSGPAEDIKTAWSQVRLEVQEDELNWNS